MLMYLKQYMVKKFFAVNCCIREKENVKSMIQALILKSSEKKKFYPKVSIRKEIIKIRKGISDVVSKKMKEKSLGRNMLYKGQ